MSRSGAMAPAFDRVLRIEEMDTVLPETDYLMVMLPNTVATRHLEGEHVLSALQRGAGVVSIGRGTAVDEAPLIGALRSGHLSGAVLDVFEREPLPAESPLWEMENVVITPQCAVDDLASYLPRVLDIFLDNLGKYLDGAALENFVDLSHGY